MKASKREGERERERERDRERERERERDREKLASAKLSLFGKTYIMITITAVSALYYIFFI